MNLLYVTQIVPYPPHGGVLQRGYNLLRELGKRHRVHLLAFHHPDELPRGKPLDTSLAELGRFCAKVEYFPLWAKQSSLHKYAAFAAAALYPKPYSVMTHWTRPLANRIKEVCTGPQPPDLVHLDTIALAPYARLCGRIPSVLAHHNVESQLMQRRAQVEGNALARFYVQTQANRLVRYERDQCPRFPLNITVSDNDSRTLESLVPGVRTESIPNGVDTEYFTPRPPATSPTMIYTGGMNMFANRDAVEWFISSVWPTVRASVPGARFLAVGGRPSPAALAAAAADPAIEVPGFVDDVRPWVERASVYVVPLRVGGGTRLKVLDAMAQGKAIVSTSLGVEGIRGVHGKHFVLADDAANFAAATIRLLNDAAERARLGAAARERAVSDYAWPKLGARLSAAYENVAKAR